MSLEQFAQEHENAIYSLVDFLLTRCPDRFDPDMNRHVEAVEVSFRRYHQHRPGDVSQERERIFRDSLGHNYTLAQCSALIAFAHAVTRICENDGNEALRASVEAIWQKLRQSYEWFFRVPFPDQADV